MEEQKTNNNTTLAVAGLVALGLVGIVSYKLMNSSTPKVDVMVSEDKKTVEVTQAFKDGTYTKTGNYVSPGGPEQIEVTITLMDGKITAASVKPMATLAGSINFQNKFKEGFKEIVIGKNITEVNLDKISGSSLTPKGFNDAIKQVIEEAKS